MLLGYEWFLFVFCLLLIVLGILLVYNAITGNPQFFPTVPAPHVGTLPATVTANGSIVRIDTAGTDPYNCGALGNFCDPALGLVCQQGQCVCGGTGFTFCPNFGCVNLQTFFGACGSCTQTGCRPGQQCCSGGCAYVNTVDKCGSCSVSCLATGSATGPAGTNMACCAGKCTDLNSSATDCGSCFHPVPSTGFRCCNGVSTAINDQNCTACGVGCGPGFVCDVVNKTCIPGCPTGQTNCGGVCKDLQNDNFNCTFCNTPCPPNTYCLGGNCTSNQCPTGFAFLNGQCYNLNTNDNCGQYGVLCPMFCQNGMCQCSTSVDCPPGYTCNGSGQCVPPTCPGGQTFCGVTQTCVNVQNGDNQGRNCGQCGNNCISGQCDNGQCVCFSSAECNTGYDCVGNRCIKH